MTLKHRALILTHQVDGVEKVVQKVRRWLAKTTGGQLELEFDFVDISSEPLLVRRTIASDTGKPALVVYPGQIERIGKNEEMARGVEYDSVCLFYDPLRLKPTPTASAASGISYYGFAVLSVMRPKSADLESQAALYAHELMHGFYQLVRKRADIEIEDDVHRHSFSDPRPHANYSDIVAKLVEYWRHLGQLDTSGIEYIFVHHTGISRGKNPDQFNATNEYHRRKWGMKSLLGFYGGYNYEIAADGTIRQFRLVGEETAAVKGYNNNSISICLDGDFDRELPTQAQVNALKAILGDLAARHKIEPENVLPHRAVARKTCYGSRLDDDWARNLLNEDPMTNTLIFKNKNGSDIYFALPVNDEAAFESYYRNFKGQDIPKTPKGKIDWQRVEIDGLVSLGESA